MTAKEVLQIKTIIEAAYPVLKPSKENDLLYITMLQEFELGPMLAAAKEHIKASPFPPTIADLLRRYDAVQVNKEHEIIRIMISKGYFANSEESDKANKWISEGVIPEWFAKDMAKYRQSQLVQNKGLLN